MKVCHNGEEIEVKDGISLSEFLMKFQYRRVLIKINGEKASTADSKKIILAEGDDIVIKRISVGG